MRKRRLGGTGLEVSELGFGCSSFWAKSAFPERDALALVHAAIDRGLTFFDTGAHYAAGQAEQRLGKALALHKNADFVVATKAGTHFAPGGRFYKDFSRAALRQSVEQSLRNLQLDAIPLLHLHSPRPEHVTDDVIETLDRLRQEGLVRHVGIHGYGVELHRKILSHPLFATAMYDFNLLSQERKPMIHELVASGRGFLGATPLAQALFSSRLFRPRRFADWWYLARALKNHRDLIMRGVRYRFVERIPGWTGGEVAIAYALASPDVSVAIFGTTSMRHLEQNLAVSGRELPREIIDRIEQAEGR